MKTYECVVIVLLGFLVEAIYSNDPEAKSTSLFCSDVNPQQSLDIQQIMGMWYSSEVISHNENKEGVYYYDTCVIIHLSDITYKITTTTEPARDYSSHARFPSVLHHQQMQRQYHYLSLIWDEMGKDIKYSLRYNESKPGLWLSYGDQKGTMMLDMQYEKFRGTIQVVKAVQSHLVLTFCNHEVNSTLFSVILTRQPQGLAEEDLRSIRGLLRRRGLSTSSIRKVCTSGAAGLTVYSIVLATLLFVSKQLI